jgi:hypothetical protein
MCPATDLEDRVQRVCSKQEGCNMISEKVVPCLCLLILLPCLGLASQDPAPEPPKSRLGIGVLVATGLGPMFEDLNSHPGFGFDIQGYLPVAPWFQMRPAFEWTGYRVNDYNIASRVLATLLGADYDETRVVFRTYRLGIDGVFYFRPGYLGPFLSAGVGAQLSRVYVEDVAVYAGSEEEITPVAAGAETTGLWLGGGVGFQWRTANVELRLSRAPYDYTAQRPLDSQPDSLPFEDQFGWALHLMIGVQF